YKIAAFHEKLNDLFPDNRILSHDYVEGAATGCLDTNICAAEDVPQNFSDSITRDIRWLRGDWQLLPYVLPRVKNRAGERIGTPLAPVARCTIAANLTISLLPVAQMLVLLLSLFTGAPLAVWLLAALPQILRALFALPCLFYSVRQTLYEWARCIFDFIMLPTVATYKFCAVCVTLYRLVVRRKLLEWRVFAHAKGNVSLLPNAVAAIVFTATAAVFSLTPLYYGLAAVFLAGIPACMLLSRERAVAVPSDALLSRLTDTAKQTFAYFAAQEDLYALPCDCYQADNGKGWCARTSPTNIGMALTAYAAAYELGLVDKARFTAYIERIIASVEACEKWRGNLYNWYDCKTLAVLPRRFVSTVDSGNFLVALSLLTTYTDGALRARIERIIEQTDLLSLFDPARRLLYIGYDEENKSCTDNHYDLLGSESALTYLCACGYGKIPKEAFYNLDRKAVRYGNALTVYSWTGGMFEYLMARLYVAPYKNTLLGQAMEGAVRAHVRYAKKHKSDFMGISECRYGAFDDCGGNLYRAFGVPQIAHAAVPANAPYAPYAAFLAQPYCRESESVRYINAYTEAGCAGNYGYYDAVHNGVPVKTYMSHHQGMLLAACANAVKRDCIPTRLLSLPAWRAARLLCGEERLAHARAKRILPTVGDTDALTDEGTYLCKCARLCVVASENETQLQYGGKRLLQNVRVSVSGAEAQLLGGDFSARESAVWRRSSKDYTS
ncbi:MAG: hypothetical protein K2L51_06765, partial [Clostridiales bacterium]|nr:hypothetical protein [Clostridiales bacterium]